MITKCNKTSWKVKIIVCLSARACGSSPHPQPDTFYHYHLLYQFDLLFILLSLLISLKPTDHWVFLMKAAGLVQSEINNAIVVSRRRFWRTEKMLVNRQLQSVYHNTTNIGEPEKVWRIWSVTVSLRPCLSFNTTQLNSTSNTSQLCRMVSVIGHGFGPLKSLPQIETISSEQSDCSQQSS